MLGCELDRPAITDDDCSITRTEPRGHTVTMTDTETYNGYTNRETWAFALHVDNDEGLYNVKEELRGANPNPHKLADVLKEWATEVLWDEEISGNSSGIQMMRREVGSLWRVNWDELASNWLED